MGSRPTQHGFNNDTTPRFDAPAAKLAWARTMAFFNQTLKADGPDRPSPA